MSGYRKIGRPKLRRRDVTKRHEGNRSTQLKSTKPKNMKNENFMMIRPQIYIFKKAEEEGLSNVW